MRITLPLIFVGILVGLGMTTGCVDRPELPPAAYGTILDTLPRLDEATKPFQFPYAGENDHRNCVFKDEDFF